MYPTRNLILSILALVVTTGALVGLTLFSFVNFNYRGSALDWIYPVSGLLIFAVIGSGAAVAVTGTKVIAQRRRIKRLLRQNGG
jgi:hypothetical protein